MNRAFFYRERKGMFVVVSLAIWLALLGLFGRQLPANASMQNKKMTVNVNGIELTGHWLKKEGKWAFQKISEANIVSVAKKAAIALKAGVEKPQIASIEHSKAPVTTSSIRSDRRITRARKAARAELADEIGRWAKIGNRWEWRRGVANPKPSKSHRERELQARWVRQGGVWVLQQINAQDLFRNI